MNVNAKNKISIAIKTTVLISAAILTLYSLVSTSVTVIQIRNALTQALCQNYTT